MVDHVKSGQPCMTLSVPEAGRRLGFGRDATYAAVHDGTIPSIRLGRRIRIPVQAIEQMLAGRSE